MKNVWFHPTEARAIGIDLALAGGMVKINTPSSLSDHAEIQFQFLRSEVVCQFWTIARIQLTASPTVAYTAPCTHRKNLFILLLSSLEGKTFPVKISSRYRNITLFDELLR
jgi:hypothetical protein